ncbi:MAG: GAF domain-containing protein, partial [Bacteroidales bacterium]
MPHQQPTIERRRKAGGIPAWPSSLRSLIGFGLVGALLVLAAANIALRATWHRVEDGVLWAASTQGVVAKEIAPGTAAAAKLRPGDLLQEIDGRPVDRVDDVYAILDSARRGTQLRYTVLRLASRELVEVSLEPIPAGNLPLYYILAAIGIFSLLVGLSVRVRRPSDPATLHFFVLSAAFFGVFSFSFSGRLDRLDWFFYWANEAAVLLLPPLFLHFTLAFPERGPRPGVLPRWLPLVYAPAVLLATADIVVLTQAGSNPRLFVDRLVPIIDRLEYLYLAACLVIGFFVWVAALRRVRTVTGRRQLRWIVSGVLFGGGPFVFGYALPYSLGAQPTLALSLLAVPLGLLPLAFASAIVRYRLMDVEVIIKRTLVYAAAILAIGGIYAALLRLVSLVFHDTRNEHTTIIAMLATLVVVLLARPVKSAIQVTFDRAFYRDRYDYRRALVGFARDLNSDLDLNRLADRLVARIVETFGVDRMALLLADDETGSFVTIRQAGLENGGVSLARASSLGARLVSGQSIALDDPAQLVRIPAEDADEWRRLELYYFVPCVSKEGCIAVLALGRREDDEPLNSEDVSLLLAVAGQVATALENGRLYRQLSSQAHE